MKTLTYALSLFALLVVACGAYLWANSLSEKERLELLDGEYELVDWQIRPTSANKMDSLMLYDIPQRGEHITLQTNDKGELQITTASSLPILQQLATLEWQSFPCIERTWLAWQHRVVGQYHAAGQSATVYWHRTFVNQKDVGITLQLPDPKNEQIGWFFIFQKK